MEISKTKLKTIIESLVREQMALNKKKNDGGMGVSNVRERPKTNILGNLDKDEMEKFLQKFQITDVDVDDALSFFKNSVMEARRLREARIARAKRLQEQRAERKRIQAARSRQRGV